MWIKQIIVPRGDRIYAWFAIAVGKLTLTAMSEQLSLYTTVLFLETLKAVSTLALLVSLTVVDAPSDLCIEHYNGHINGN